ncbi:DNA methyltransferase [Bdellovibrio sp. SKB1291214]|uniref:DNA methyltransferase n=1 Tax=Bdellovibrio sp. SKB1291214 TaxID=1732569 RepID=UPI000B51DD8B|nr:DNA methyltransferase [Bdellovibrio sp. SKB1291214]UYL09442.1 DNA methyltransferase [Bdellovibrio sp. SKB1291214]
MGVRKTLTSREEGSGNYVICGDNLEWLKLLEDESIDLCYIDPPFFSNRPYEILWGNGYERRSFEDRFSGKVLNYIEWMRPRIELIHKKLKKTGSIFLHCDWHASHRLRCVLDDVFGEDNFRNEIIWKRTFTTGSSKSIAKKFSANTDTIFFYQKSKDSYFNVPYKDYAPATLKRYDKVDENGRRFKWENLKTYSKDRLKEMLKSGEAKFNKGSKNPVYKAYLDPNKGTPMDNLWDDIEFIGTKSPERLGYPTQKPEALLRRIIECASKKGDVVLDCFGGGGTTAKVCADLGRTFITGDVSPVSVKIISERLYFDVPDVKFEIKNLPQTEEELKQMNGHKFAEVVCEVMGWDVNTKKSGDGGIDGWADGGKLPIQIKNHATAPAGRPDLQRFFGALGKNKKGIFVAWRFASEAREYIAKVKQDHKVEIVAMECSAVFGGLLLEKAKGEEIEKLYLERRPKNWAKNVAKAEAHQKVLEKIAKAKNKPIRKKKQVEAG